jgi:hypothetical protein
MNVKKYCFEHQLAVCLITASAIFLAGILLVLFLDQNTRYPAVRNAQRWLAVNEIANSLMNYYQSNQQWPAGLNEQWQLLGRAADCAVACQDILTEKTCLAPEAFAQPSEYNNWLAQKYSRFSQELSGYAVSWQGGQLKVKSCFADLGEKIETYRLLNKQIK